MIATLTPFLTWMLVKFLWWMAFLVTYLIGWLTCAMICRNREEDARRDGEIRGALKEQIRAEEERVRRIKLSR